MSAFVTPGPGTAVGPDGLAVGDGEGDRVTVGEDVEEPPESEPQAASSRRAAASGVQDRESKFKMWYR